MRRKNLLVRFTLVRFTLVGVVTSCVISCRTPDQVQQPVEKQQIPRSSAPSDCINLNTASVKQLESLPGIGEVIAKRIIEYRERQGPFRRPEEVIIIDGVSEAKYRQIEDRLCAGD